MAVVRSAETYEEEQRAFDPQRVEEEFSLETLRSALGALSARDLLRILNATAEVNAAFESHRVAQQSHDASPLGLQRAVYDLHEALVASGLRSQQLPAPEDAYGYLLSSMQARSKDEGWYNGADTLDERVGRTLDHFGEPGFAEMRGYIGARTLKLVPDYPNQYFAD